MWGVAFTACVVFLFGDVPAFSWFGGSSILAVTMVLDTIWCHVHHNNRLNMMKQILRFSIVSFLTTVSFFLMTKPPVQWLQWGSTFSQVVWL
jgi:hypothetical protein